MGKRTSGQTDPEGYLSGHRHDRSCSSPFNVITFLNRSSCGREGVHFHFQNLVEGDEAGVCCSARRQDTNEEDQDTGRATLSPRAAPPMTPRPTVIMFVIVRFSRMGHPHHSYTCSNRWAMCTARSITASQHHRSTAPHSTSHIALPKSATITYHPWPELWVTARRRMRVAPIHPLSMRCRRICRCTGPPFSNPTTTSTSTSTSTSTTTSTSTWCIPPTRPNPAS